MVKFEVCRGTASNSVLQLRFACTILTACKHWFSSVWMRKNLPQMPVYWSKKEY